MVCPAGGYNDVDYFKLTQNLFGKYEDLQQKIYGTWYSICEPSYEGYIQFCRFLDGAVEVVKIFENLDNSKYTTLYDFELKLMRSAEYQWNAEQKMFTDVDSNDYEQCKMLADIK